MHAEGYSLAERLNQSVKRILSHVCKDKPKQWHKLLPLVLWCIRKSKNETLSVRPFMMAMGWNPTNPLKFIKESWIRNHLSHSGGKSVNEYLTELQDKLTVIHDYADAQAKVNSRSM